MWALGPQPRAWAYCGQTTGHVGAQLFWATHILWAVQVGLAVTIILEETIIKHSKKNIAK